MSRPDIIAVRNGAARYWHVGDFFLMAYPAPGGWDVRARGRPWPGSGLLLDGHFATGGEAARWCDRMADVLARDQADG
jgi:hypothetical protein